MGCVGHDRVGLSEHPFITPGNCKAFRHRFYPIRINGVCKVVVLLIYVLQKKSYQLNKRTRLQLPVGLSIDNSMISVSSNKKLIVNT